MEKQPDFKTIHDACKRLNPYSDMLRAVDWAAAFIYAVTHPEATEVIGADVASGIGKDGFNVGVMWLLKWQTDQVTK